MTDEPTQAEETSETPEEPEFEPLFSIETIAQAEQVLGLSFTLAEREQMHRLMHTRLEQIQRLRDIKLNNSVPMALGFDVRLPADRSPVVTVDRSIQSTPIDDIERPANLEDVAFYPVTHLAKLLQSRQVTSVELTGMYLERLKHYNKHLECVITFTEDLAMQQARRADAEIAGGHIRSPLHGIPWGAKDLLAVKGYPTTWGAAPYKDQTIDMNATVVERLDAAGAVLIAKLTLGALAYNDIWFGGRTNNPWDINEGSSGSSAGSAAATAAGLVGFAIGTETLGSIVSPSTRCGVTGLRPTFGRVSRHGAMALVGSMDKIGPMCRTVEDCALVFNAIYGPDGHDGEVVHAPFKWKPDMDVTKLRVGYLKASFDEERDNKANDDAVLDGLRSVGIELIPIELPQFDLEAMIVILFAEAAATFDEITRENLDDLMQWQEDQAWPNTFRQARFIPAVEYIHANRVRTRAMHEMAALMQDIDVFVSPAFTQIGGTLVMTNFTGHPCVVLPNGFTERHTPTSITFVGKLFGEAETLAVAKAYQDATDFHKQYPPMDYGE